MSRTASPTSSVPLIGDLRDNERSSPSTHDELQQQLPGSAAECRTDGLRFVSRCADSTTARDHQSSVRCQFGDESDDYGVADIVDIGPSDHSSVLFVERWFAVHVGHLSAGVALPHLCPT
jgi:hypothetical protein